MSAARSKPTSQQLRQIRQHRERVQRTVDFRLRQLVASRQAVAS